MVQETKEAGDIMGSFHASILRIPLPLLILIAVILLTQGTFLFLDARKRNAYPWLWGLWGLMSAPTPTIIYLLVVRKVWKHFIKKEKE